MIGFLRGEILIKQPPMLVLDVQGVGYELEAPMTTFYNLPDTGQPATVYTHMVVREDAQRLYAFTDLKQRGLFRSLLRVNGVGPRVALAILSGLSAEEFFACVMNDDATQLTRVPGIGRKTAQRLLVEMRDKLTPDDESGLPAIASAPVGTVAANPAQDAISALISLGYKPADATRAVRSLPDKEASSEELIRQALQSITGGAR
ncbi:MAG: Holliday junction branch migration protein RuvA [Gammaproteobacteria bacterium]|nr:Holliday junction branch migration protein RuvA [Gammaproteobacteria bacterium]